MRGHEKLEGKTSPYCCCKLCNFFPPSTHTWPAAVASWSCCHTIKITQNLPFQISTHKKHHVKIAQIIVTHTTSQLLAWDWSPTLCVFLCWSSLLVVEDWLLACLTRVLPLSRIEWRCYCHLQIHTPSANFANSEPPHQAALHLPPFGWRKQTREMAILQL